MSINYSPAELDKLRKLRFMKSVALWLLIVMALIFAVSFALQDRYPVFGFIRAASEGGMVGAIADWFAVTALFRHPLGLKIPHTNLIARKKDEIGQSLGDFIEENFLAEDVIRTKLASMDGARRVGEWLSDSRNSRRVADLSADTAVALIEIVDDKDVQSLFADLMRRHVIEPEWSGNIGRVLTRVLSEGHAETAVDVIAENLAAWLRRNPNTFDTIANSRLPSWVPSFAGRFVDRKLYSEVLRFVEDVRAQPNHPARATLYKIANDFATDLSENPALMGKVENLKLQIFSSSRVREIAASVWSGAREALVDSLRDTGGMMRERISRAIKDVGSHLASDSSVQSKVDSWVTDGVLHIVGRYSHDIAGIIGETVERWDAREATRKIELQVGRDLQFIRINGTVVGALAGLTIYSVAIAVSRVLS